MERLVQRNYPSRATVLLKLIHITCTAFSYFVYLRYCSLDIRF